MKICIREEENVSELFLPPAEETVQSLLSYTAEDYFQIEQMRCEELKGVLTAWRKVCKNRKRFEKCLCKMMKNVFQKTFDHFGKEYFTSAEKFSDI
ncbi:hypothetical protein CEXT_565861 [Caerostris extrusa]|uniref:Uncharacterized protein n=1 Tax=Caerostris extrusa TaxID=172846 RepID=A0AAV4PFF4_CAEEX|nr:hypothetical protein CEXT_565861 [Caerostris extrusa]